MMVDFAEFLAATTSLLTVKTHRARRCTACDHAERRAIDKALVDGEVLRKISQSFSLSIPALYRHKAHIARALAEARSTEVVEQGRDLQQELLKLSRRAERLADEAERKGDLRAAIAAIRELARLVALEATVYPQAKSGKIPVEQLQALILAARRDSEEEEVIEVE